MSGAGRNGKAPCLRPVFMLLRSEMRTMIWSSSNVPRLSSGRSDHAHQRLVCTDVLLIFYEAIILKLFKCIDCARIQACLWPCS